MTDLFRPRADADASETVDEALELVGLEGFADSYPPDLSLGQRKLVTVARALAGRPKMLLLDEPAAGLDSGESQELGRELKRLQDRGLTIFLVDHDMDLVLGVCDSIHVLEFGKLIASGTPAEIRADERVIHAYLGVEDEQGEWHDVVEEADAMTAVLECQSLTAGYAGVPVVRDLDLQVEAGEVVALLGPNGAGKTTTLLTLAGVISPISGQREGARRGGHRRPPAQGRPPRRGARARRSRAVLQPHRPREPEAGRRRQG